MTRDEEWVKMEYDWYLAQFQIVCGSLLATLLALFFGAIVGQVAPLVAWITISGLAVDTAIIWHYYTVKLRQLRESLNKQSSSIKRE
jgi:hypothetical protein